ncbi:hypothetical protein V502_07970 [Pseudogymnoascus sp. VKM F-4520 (FW-2644)]|nr:hypothetical protein V502_07970 [Pseudogymnoascus sp. VKM F-4520 (FW-2644)]
MLTVSTDLQNPLPGRAIWVKDELYNFLYQDGSNPFRVSPGKNFRAYIREGFGREKDSFDPDHERPHVDDYDLADMGYIKYMGPRHVPRCAAAAPTAAMILYIVAETPGALVNSTDPLTALSPSQIFPGRIFAGLATLETPSNTMIIQIRRKYSILAGIEDFV